MEGIRPGLIIAGWLVMLASAIANGTLGEYVFKPRWGEYGAHVYKTMVGVVVAVAISWFYASWTVGPHWKTAAWTAGISWLMLTVGFEFIFGHYVMHHPWERLIADYRIWRGRLWPVLLAALLLAPVVLGLMVNGG